MKSMKIGDWFCDGAMWLAERVGMPITVALMAVVLITISVGGFFFSRWLHWTVFYSNDTKQVVCEMVKPEYLKNPEDCK